MIKLITIVAFLLAAVLGATSIVVDPAWIGVTSEPAQILVTGGTGILAMVCLLGGVLGAAALILRGMSGPTGGGSPDPLP
ncbi:MAG: hypothetical protein ACYTGG_14560 [Planctomycetota bacterium]|jgi:hypothetical protein